MVVIWDCANIVVIMPTSSIIIIFTSKSSGEEDRTGIGILTPGLEGIGTSLVLKIKLEARFWKENPLFDFLTSSGPPESWPQSLYFDFLNWCGTDFVHGSDKLRDKNCVTNMNRRLWGKTEENHCQRYNRPRHIANWKLTFHLLSLFAHARPHSEPRGGALPRHSARWWYVSRSAMEWIKILVYMLIKSKPDLPWDPTPSHGFQGLSPCL